MFSLHEERRIGRDRRQWDIFFFGGGFLNMKGSQVNQQEGEANKLHEYIVSLFAHLLNNYFCVRNDKVEVMVAWHL